MIVSTTKNIKRERLNDVVSINATYFCFLKDNKFGNLNAVFQKPK